MAAKNMENLTDSTDHQITHSFPFVRKGMYLFLIFVSVHVIGIIFIVINSLYLRCTRGSGSVRMNEGDFDRSDRKRCCKLRGAVACNVVLIAHMFLTMTEGIMALLYQSPSLYSYKLNTAYWALFGINYGILVLAFLPCAYEVDAFNIYAHLGHIHACNAFEFFNFIIFWASLILAVTSKVFGYEIQIFLPRGFGYMGPGHAILALLLSYFSMFIGAGCYFTQFKIDKEIISKEEAVQLISQKIREAPSIQWIMSLGEARARSESFHSSNWQYLETKYLVADLGRGGGHPPAL